MSLTHTQLKLLSYIDGFIKANGYCPSYRNMADALGYKSTSGIAVKIYALEDRGYISRIPAATGSIEVLKTPFTTVCKHCGGEL